jgi:hypothetical protein
LEGRHGEVDFRPQRGDHQLFPAGFLHRINEPPVLRRVDQGAIYRLLVGEDILNSFDDVTAAFLQNRREDRWNIERLCRLGQGDNIVDDELWLVAVSVRKLKS